MKEILILIITLLLLGFLPSRLKSQGMEERPLEYFNKVLIQGHFELVLEQGDEPSIQLEGRKPGRLHEVLTEVSNQKLRINYKRDHGKWKWDTYPRITIHLIYPALEDLRVEGKVRLATRGAVKGEDLNLLLHGHVTGAIEIMVGKLDLESEGYTKLELSGVAGEQIIELDGLGKINGLDLSSQTADVALDGAATAHINVTKELHADVDGVSKLKYKGKPVKTTIRKDGWSGVAKIDD